MQSSEYDRLIHLLVRGGLLLLGGALYAWIAARFGGISCVFHLVTGLKCPGCGVTRMCLSLLRGDLRGAFGQNPAVLCMLPAGAVVCCSRCAAYVRTGEKRLATWENVLVWSMIVVLVLFGILRNVAEL